MPVFTRSTSVKATPEALFRFHENPRNLRDITPPGLRVLGIEASDNARAGDEFTIDVRQGPMPLRWTGRWETVEPPRLLVDVGVGCPFALWRHSHIFQPHSGGSILTDRVEFRLPWHRGGPLGDFVCKFLIFPRMFAGRHAATREYFRRMRP